MIRAFYQRDEHGLPRRSLAMMRARFGTRPPSLVLDYFTQCYAPAAKRVDQLRLLPDWGG